MLSNIRHYLNYKLVIVLCMFLLMFANMGLTSTSFPVFQPYINALPGMTDTMGSWLVAARMLTAFLVTFVAAALYKKFDSRFCVAFSCFLNAFGFVMFAFAQSAIAALTAMCCLGAAYGLGATVALTLVAGRWFSENKSTAIAIGSMGTGFAATILPYAITSIIETTSFEYGLLFDAALAIFVGVFCLIFMRNKPPKHLDPQVVARNAKCDETAKKSKEIDQSEQSAGTAKSSKEIERSRHQVSMKRKHAHITLSKSHYLLMCLAILLLGMCSVGCNAYLAVLMKSSGLDPYITAIILTVSGFALFVFKPLIGLLFDRVGTSMATLISTALLVFGLILLCTIQFFGLPAAIAGAFFAFAGLPICTIGESTYALDFSTEKTRARTIRDFQLFFTAGTFVTNLFPGLLFDIFGSYEITYFIFTLAAAGAGVIAVSICRKHGI